MEQTLLLNATYEPLDVVSWQRAMTLWCQGKVEIVETHDTEVRAVTFTFKLPSVVRLLRFVRQRKRNEVPFTRANIYTRDKYTCQYCHKEFHSNDLTFDHIIPVSRGGRRNWENIITACVPCNRKKANRTPEEAGMHLSRMPRRPTNSPAFRLSLGYKKAPQSWADYIYWNAELDID
jgi:5-methylcytosine-specific restriction endonuclease McrA